MIGSIAPGSMIHVDGSYNGLPYISSNPNNPMQGVMRVNGSNIEVFNGSSWTILAMSYPSISVNGAAQTAILWAQQKMAEEENLKQLAARHPAVADAMNAINEAYDKLKVVVALTEEENK